jgi:hypothetical protein
MNAQERRAWRRLRRTWEANIDQFRADGITWEMLERTWRLACIEAEGRGDRGESWRRVER